jgi:hypothetical protein
MEHKTLLSINLLRVGSELVCVNLLYFAVVLEATKLVSNSIRISREQNYDEARVQNAEWEKARVIKSP